MNRGPYPAMLSYTKPTTPFRPIHTMRPDSPNIRSRRDKTKKTARRSESMDDSFPIMKLPRELRDQIWKEALVPAPAIEFWPMSPSGKSNAEHPLDFLHSVTKKWRQDIAGGLLRVSKQVQEETTQILYGQNEFRFTGPNGWQVMACFFYSITAEARSYIRSVSVCADRWGPSSNEPFNSEPTFFVGFHNVNTLKTFRSEIQKMGLYVPEHYTLDTWDAEGFDFALENLQQMPSLRSLDVLLPSWYVVDQQRGYGVVTRDWHCWDADFEDSKVLAELQDKASRLQVSFVRLRRDAALLDKEHYFPGEDLRLPPSSNPSAVAMWTGQLAAYGQAWKCGLPIKDAALDTNGDYTVGEGTEWWTSQEGKWAREMEFEKMKDEIESFHAMWAAFEEDAME